MALDAAQNPRLIAPRLSPQATADLVLLRTGKPADELRSYRYFQEVTAPSIAGAMNSEFWYTELPRVCEGDPALWHAVVSLGSAYETYLCNVNSELPGKPANQRNAKTLTQFNAAIRGLKKSLSSPGNLWKALTASAVFICVLILDGQVEEARLHFRYACRLLNEIDSESSKESLGDPGEAAYGTRPRKPSSLPVSLESLRAILIGFEFVATKLNPTTTAEAPKLITSNYQDYHSAWKVFTVPPIPTNLNAGYLNVSNLAKAARAAESLFMTLVVESLKNIHYFRSLYAEGGFALVQAAPKYKDSEICVRSFKTIQRALALFRADLEGPRGKRIRPTELRELRKAYLFLRIIQETNRSILQEDPDEPDPHRRLKSLHGLCSTLIDLTEQVYELSTSVGCHREGGPVPTSTVMNPLVHVVRTGFHRASRERSIRLLSEPRLEGIWDSRMVAEMAKKFLNRETVATEEYRRMPELDGITIDHPSARGWDGSLNEPGQEEQGEFIHSLARICMYSIEVSSAREVNVTLWTWKEWLERGPGETSYMTW